MYQAHIFWMLKIQQKYPTSRTHILVWRILIKHKIVLDSKIRAVKEMAQGDEVELQGREVAAGLWLL